MTYPEHKAYQDRIICEAYLSQFIPLGHQNQDYNSYVVSSKISYLPGGFTKTIVECENDQNLYGRIKKYMSQNTFLYFKIMNKILWVLTAK